MSELWNEPMIEHLPWSILLLAAVLLLIAAGTWGLLRLREWVFRPRFVIVSVGVDTGTVRAVGVESANRINYVTFRREADAQAWVERLNAEPGVLTRYSYERL